MGTTGARDRTELLKNAGVVTTVVDAAMGGVEIDESVSET